MCVHLNGTTLPVGRGGVAVCRTKSYGSDDRRGMLSVVAFSLKPSGFKTPVLKSTPSSGN